MRVFNVMNKTYAGNHPSARVFTCAYRKLGATESELEVDEWMHIG